MQFIDTLPWDILLWVVITMIICVVAYAFWYFGHDEGVKEGFDKGVNYAYKQLK